MTDELTEHPAPAGCDGELLGLELGRLLGLLLGDELGPPLALADGLLDGPVPADVVYGTWVKAGPHEVPHDAGSEKV